MTLQDRLSEIEAEIAKLRKVAKLAVELVNLYRTIDKSADYAFAPAKQLTEIERILNAEGEG